MSGFNTRVMLLQKWAPNLLPQLKDIDDLADIILDVWDEAEAYAEQRIVKLLEAKADQVTRAGSGKPMPERMEYLAVEISIRQIIAIIKENK